MGCRLEKLTEHLQPSNTGVVLSSYLLMLTEAPLTPLILERLLSYLGFLQLGLMTKLHIGSISTHINRYCYMWGLFHALLPPATAKPGQNQITWAMSRWLLG